MSARPFNDFVREHRNGITHDDLSNRLQELVAAVAAEGKAGKLVLTIAMKPAGSGSGAFEVQVDTTLKLPKPAPGASIFFVSPENNLVRSDPRQSTLELREVGPAAAFKGIA